MTALRTIDVIQGKPTVSPQLMLGLINASGQLENIEIVETRNNQAVSCTMKRRYKTSHTEIFGFEEANKLGLTQKDNYKRQPMVMFRWRAVAACARVVFPDVVLGIYTAEEMGKEVEFTQDGEVIEVQPLSEVPTNNVTPLQSPKLTASNKYREEVAEICGELKYSSDSTKSALAKFDSFKTEKEQYDALLKMRGRLEEYNKRYSDSKTTDEPPAKTLREVVREQDEKPIMTPRELAGLQIFEALKDGANSQVKLTPTGDTLVLFAPNEKEEWQDNVITVSAGKLHCDCVAFKSISKAKPDFRCEHINGVNSFLEYQAALNEAA